MVSNAYGREGSLAGISTGYPSIDKVSGGMANGRLVVLAARPGMGKSSLALNIGFNIATAFYENSEDKKGPAKSGGRVLMASLEMSNEEIGVRFWRSFPARLKSGKTSGLCFLTFASLVLSNRTPIKSCLSIEKITTTRKRSQTPKATIGGNGS